MEKDPLSGNVEPSEDYIWEQAGSARFKGEAQKLARDGVNLAAAAGRKVKDYGANALEEQKERAVEGLNGLVSTVRRGAEHLRTGEDSRLAEMAEGAAEQLDVVERYLRDRDVNDLYGDLHRFARRRPEVVIGGMFIAGVALARFLKAGYRASPRPAGASTGSSSSRVAAGPLVSPTGEPIIPSRPSDDFMDRSERPMSLDDDNLPEERV